MTQTTRDLTRAARSLLFVPGTRPDRFARAADSGADAVIIDLEDAVSEGDKHDARTAAAHYVARARSLVRINGAGTDWHEQDLMSLIGADGLAGVVVPKAETVEQLVAVREALGGNVPVLALIETAAGLRDAPVLAQVPGLTRLLLGHLDLCLSLGVPSPANRLALLYARSQLVVASRAAGLPGPVDGVQPNIDDDRATAADAAHAVELGFEGKLCVHPRQVPIVHDALRPAASEVEWASRIVIAAGGSAGGALRVNGEMIDKPRLELAHRILDRAGGDAS